MRRTLHSMTAVAALAVALAGCGAGTEAAAPSSAAADGAGSTATTAEVAVDIQDFAFSPETLEVVAGTTVTWTNRDSFAHTVTSGPPDEPDGTFDEALGDPTAHEGVDTTATVTFDEPGTYAYFCDLHPSMVGEVVVTAP